jgi:hypothetical protein
MIVHRVKQGSVEWHMARAGVISASKFKLLRESAKLKTGPNKGDYKDDAKKLAFHLAIERIAKAPVEGEDWVGWQAERGVQLESQARMQHELRHDVLVEEVGFVTTDDGKFGASADGFIGDDEGAEYKCFLAPDKLRAILLSGDVTDVIDQCDGGMWITHRKAWNFGLYCPALAPIGLDFVLHRIERNDDRIFELERDLVAFDKLVEEYRAALSHRAKAGLPAPDPAPWSGADELATARPATAAKAPAATPTPQLLPESIFG